ncbi:MAG: superoxide dismutase [Planctomycetes bacterium]|nr:superoxide dismutase [Planctomycetota bacterium]
MKPTVKFAFFSAILCAALFLGNQPAARSHCEIPCGIYNDPLRIDLLFEHVTTVEKSMQVILELTEEAAKESPNVNQMVRWVKNKEDHADEIQHIASQYFMTQRVKPKTPQDPARGAYVNQLTSLHHILIHAMKAKQSVDLSQCEHLRNLIKEFAQAYFTAEEFQAIMSRNQVGEVKSP